jgi:integrase
MASVNKDDKGWKVEFTVRGGPRKRLRLGKGINERSAREIGRHVERMIESRTTALSLASETAKWVLGLPDQLRQRLVELKLIDDTGRRGARSLGGFLDEYVSGRTDLKPGSIENIKVARRWLEKYFGADRDMASITAGDADAYRIWLGTTSKQAENTVRRLCSRARQFFRSAVRQRLIPENPFADMKKLAVGASPKARVEFVDEATAQKALAACPDSHWRVIFALARYGGLRVPSEVCALEWQHIDWDSGSIRVPCPKTEHHDGKDIRLMPLFPEIRKELEAWLRKAPKHRPFVLKSTISPKTNLRTGLIKILKRAGIKPWPKLFQNLRSTRATELRDRFPTHVVAAWLGHTVKVADAHYNQVTDEHFRRAVGVDRKEEPPAHGAA